MGTPYHELDLDEDPIIRLPCGHFFATSTLDGIMGINSFYETDREGRFVDLKDLSEAESTEKHKQCPICRAAIRSVFRYGRISRFADLRSLERKHLLDTNEVLKTLEGRTGPGILDTIAVVEKTIASSPMRKVYDACQGDMSGLVPRPPPLPMLRLLQMKAAASANLVSDRLDGKYTETKEIFLQAIDLAAITESSRSGARLRLDFALFLVKCCNTVDETLRREVSEQCDAVLDDPAVSWEMMDNATRIKENVLSVCSPNEIASVVQAMGRGGGYDYGGGWGDHWFECPNGHPYFIGECGGAMETSSCPECGATVGGNHHQLDSTNRRAGGGVATALTQLGR